MQLIILISLALVAVVSGQFGGSSCDYNRLAQAAQRKSQCIEEFYQMKMDAIREIQRFDRQCNAGWDQAVQQCEQPIKDFEQQNDLDSQGVMECCFPGRIGGGGGGFGGFGGGNSNRQCAWKDKTPMFGGKGGKKGDKKGGKHGGRGGRGMGGGPGMMEEMERKKKQSMTLAGACMMHAGELIEMVEHLMWCENEERMINDQAMSAYRTNKDKLLSKISQCVNMIVSEASNCTDVTSEDIECLGNGMEWSKQYSMGCYMSCHADSLPAFCRMFTQQTGSQAFNNNNNNNMGFSLFNSGK